MTEKNHQPETLMAHYAEDRTLTRNAVVPPIFQNSLFTFDHWEAAEKALANEVDSYVYSRGNNPSVVLAEEKIARLAGGERAKLFSSGMAAISAAILHCLKPGDHVVAVRNVYGPTRAFLDYLHRKMNIRTSFVGGKDITEFEQALTEQTALIYLESPSSIVFSLQDIEAAARLARSRGIKTIIDNTWATPYFQKPLARGIDLEVHSVTKYLAGHSDLVAGIVIGRDADLIGIAANEYALIGGIMSPFNAWLLTRSLRSLVPRLLMHQANAMAVARFLESHPRIRRVNYPGLDSFPQHALALKQMTGFTSLMSFELDSDDAVATARFVDRLELFLIGVSWGGHESLVFASGLHAGKEMPSEEFNARGFRTGTVRISVGLENSNDLIADLDRALAGL
jgi:cystathionine beta-lyase/cystathionine gamma-synthase